MTEHEIAGIVPESIAEELGIEVGDRLIEINSKEIKDIFDYYFLVEDEYLELTILKPNNEEWVFEIEKDYSEDLGIKFQDDLMDKYKSCRNKCIFCFIDQMPKGMRNTLYFKDDDSRLSFLKGNYITLTNMKEEDIVRIIKYKMSPINISVHTTNEVLRVKMLKNKNAGKVLEYMQRLIDEGITLNGQIVLCKGVNDGDELVRTLHDLYKFVPTMQSVSVVPVGISKYRDGLHEMKPFTKEDAKEVIKTIEEVQNKAYEAHGTHFVHASDEFYILADEEVPHEDRYDDYLQFENGVGMLRLLINQFKEYTEKLEGDQALKKRISLATSKLPLPYIKESIALLNEKYPNVKVDVHEIINHFFGERITVSGLLTGGDIIKQLKGKDLGDYLILPNNLLKADTDILLDDLKIHDIEKALNVKIILAESDGKHLIHSILYGNEGLAPEAERTFRAYE